jgi:hypothetical protein
VVLSRHATSCLDSRLAEEFARLSPRSKFAKELRKLQLEHLLASSILDSDRLPAPLNWPKNLASHPGPSETTL